MENYMWRQFPTHTLWFIIYVDFTKCRHLKCTVKIIMGKKSCDPSIYIYISCLFWNLKLHCWFQKKKKHPLLSGPFLSQKNSVHTATTYIYKIQYTFTASSPLPLISRNVFLSSDFLNKVQGSQELKSFHTQNYWRRVVTNILSR